MKIFSLDKKFFLVLITLTLIFTVVVPVQAASNQLHIVKYANDGSTILAEKTVTYQEMESSLPVQGDAVTHYYLQGPVFVDDPNEAVEEQLRWNPDEDTNVQEKDVGAVKGTEVKDLCNLVGGMKSGETLKIKASDGMTKEFAYKNVYTPPARQGPMVITWYKDGHYPDSGYDEGMRLLFFADSSVNPWGEHVFGNFDWHESADPQYWYYYQEGTERYPTTTGLSVKYVSDIMIYSSQSPGSGSGGSGGGAGISRPAAGAAPADDTSQYGYQGSKLATYASGSLNGTIRLFFNPNSSPVVVNNRIQEYTIPFDLPPRSNLTLARLYIYVSRSHGIQTNRGVIPSLQTSFNLQPLDEEKVYIDTDGDDTRNVSATYAYDVLRYMTENSSSAVSLRNPDYDQNLFSVDTVMLLIGYENDQGPYSRYWIDEGCDVILSVPRKGIFPRDAVTFIPFTGSLNTTKNLDASLMIVTTGTDSVNTTEHAVRFGNGTWYNAFDNTSASPVLHIPVTSFLNVSGNSASIESTIRKLDADYLVTRNAILVIEQKGADYEAGPNPIHLTPGQSVFGNSSLLPGTNSPETNLTSHQIGSANSSVLPPLLSAGNTTQPCRLTLHSNPEGALIFVDGTYLGKTTPYSLNVTPGEEHSIRMELDGFLPAEKNLTANNDTTVCEHLYLNSGIYSPKGQSDILVQERGMTHDGGLYIRSRPGPATISLNGILMPQRTPAVVYGLKEGTYTVKLSLERGDLFLKGASDIRFGDQEVYVHPYCIIPVDVAANSSPLRDIIIDSRDLRGEPFTVNGHAIQKTIPDVITTPVFDSFITVFHNLSYISYALPVVLNEDHYLDIQPRVYSDLNIFVDSKPRRCSSGASSARRFQYRTATSATT